MNPFEMRYLGKQLEKSGFKVHYVFYQSVLKTVGTKCARHLRQNQ